MFRLRVGFISLILVGMGVTLNAQKTVWSTFQKHNNGNSTINIIGETSEGLLSLRYSDRNLKKNVFIDFFDFSMRIKNSVGIGLRKQELEKLLLFEDRLYAVYDENSFRSKKLLIKPINYKQKEKKELQEWIEIPYNGIKINSFDLHYDDQRTLGALCYQEDHSDFSMIRVQYFNKNMKLEEKASYELKERQKNIRIHQRLIDANGNFYIIISTFKGGFFSKDDEQYFLLSYNRNEEEWRMQLLNDQEVFVSSIKMKNDLANNRVLLSYFYSLRYRNGNYGLASLSFSAENQNELFSNTKIIDKDFTRQITGDKIGKEKELTSFVIKDIIPTADSGCVVIGERFFLTDQNETFYQNGLPVTTSRNVYHFEEIVLFSLNKYGSLRWNKLVLKRQNSINDGGYYSSFVAIPSPTHIHILFNEKLVYNGDVIQYSIDKEGNSSKKNIFRRDMASYMIVPVESRVVGYNRAAIPVFMSNGDRGILKLVF